MLASDITDVSTGPMTPGGGGGGGGGGGALAPPHFFANQIFL